MSAQTLVRLGYAIGTGAPVEVPLAHTFVTGQTQQSGKTTALEALAVRSGRAALAFITKRGESLHGHRIRPFLPKDGTQPIHWRLVETIMASALGQRHLKYERFQILNAAKNAKSLADVRANLTRLAGKSKSRVEETYTLLGEYLDLVLPEMAALATSDTLSLAPGLNIMDLGEVSASLQALVIRAALERINRVETHILTVLPEAWQFAPRDLNAPAKEEAIHMARKGAAPSVQNYLLCDSQDIAGVAPVLRQASSVWVLGVQREINEVKRMLQMIPGGIAKPKAADVAALGLGEFYVCVGATAVKTYVQPTWMPAALAKEVALGMNVQTAAEIARAKMVKETAERVFAPMESVGAIAGRLTRRQTEDTVTKDEAEALRQENLQLRGQIIQLQGELTKLTLAQTKESHARLGRTIAESQADLGRTGATGTTGGGKAGVSGGNTFPESPGTDPFAAADDEAFYQRLKARLQVEAPAILQILATRPELEISVERPILTAEGDSVKGRLGQLIAHDFFASPQSGGAVQKELASQGFTLSPGSLYPALDELAKLGFLRITDGKDERSRPRKEYQTVHGMKASVKIRKAS